LFQCYDYIIYYCPINITIIKIIANSYRMNTTLIAKNPLTACHNVHLPGQLKNRAFMSQLPAPKSRESSGQGRRVKMKGDTALKARVVEGRRRRGKKEDGKEEGLTAGGAGTSGEAARTLEKSWRQPAHSLPHQYPLSWSQQMAALQASLRQGHVGQSLLLFVCGCAVN